ncbi:hypothetical protein [Kitasatospora purpeofusca]|uniref:hypothetical protein n=1 Tax=Kitasatospora purpeofusca TaxID=67352 RepID=UPI002A5A0A71|nr:hypothetical protein [Kitasatospora purpeofusca]MDY0815069.1 hypothetical protein [Kitasatospora purpeofusca]
MKRFVAVLAAGAALSGLGVAGAGQAAATPTTTCGYGVGAQVCLTIDGRLASATGWASSTGGAAQFASFTLELRTTGGASLEREDLGAVVPAGGITVGPVASTVPCGTGLTATLTTTRTGRPTVTATVSVPAVC